MNSKDKGKRGERELAEFLRVYGFEARRGVQFSGGIDSPDVITNIDGVHFEVKRTETIRMSEWLEQAAADAGANIPVVAWRRNRGEWIAILPMKDLLKLLAMQPHPQGG